MLEDNGKQPSPSSCTTTHSADYYWANTSQHHTWIRTREEVVRGARNPPSQRVHSVSSVLQVGTTVHIAHTREARCALLLFTPDKLFSSCISSSSSSCARTTGPDILIARTLAASCWMIFIADGRVSWPMTLSRTTWMCHPDDCTSTAGIR